MDNAMLQLPPELLAGIPGLRGAEAPAAPPPPSPAPEPNPLSLVGPESEPVIPPMSGTGDPILDAMLSGEVQLPSVPERSRPTIKKPTWGHIDTLLAQLEAKYERRLSRIADDVAIYRQAVAGVHQGWNKMKEEPWVHAAVSNLVNKLSNMMAGGELVYQAPHRDEETEDAAQAEEDFAYYVRECEEENYVGGDQKRDEFWYYLVTGSLVTRHIPDDRDDEYPLLDAVIDPSTCFPVWGGPKDGLVKMGRRYRASAADVVRTYGESNPEFQNKLLRKLKENEHSIDESLSIDGEVVEYWDKEWWAISFMDVKIQIERHGLGVVPFVYTSPLGEPQSFSAPLAKMSGYVDEWGNGIGYQSSGDKDYAEKAVSVFHYLKRNHQQMEAMYTLLRAEVEKAANMPTITYVAPQAIGQLPDPLDTSRGGNNHRIAGIHQVEAIPTSPRPTDLSPLLNAGQQTHTEGSMPALAFGNESGSNVSGFAVDSLMAAAKELVVPYAKTYEKHQTQVTRLKMTLYRDLIAPSRVLAVPQRSEYGSSNAVSLLTREHMDKIGIKVRAKLIGAGQQNRIIDAQYAQMMISSGLWSQKKAMDENHIRNPDAMLSEIIAEKGMQHPMTLEMFLIPLAYMMRGDTDLAKFWLEAVVAPQAQQMGLSGSAALPMGGGPPQPPGGLPGGSQGLQGPQNTGFPQGGQPPAPGGPQEGQGRGPGR